MSNVLIPGAQAQTFQCNIDGGASERRQHHGYFYSTQARRSPPAPKWWSGSTVGRAISWWSTVTSLAPLPPVRSCATPNPDW